MAVDSNAWTSLANVKEHLQIASTDTSKDAFLENLINRSYKVLEKYIGRQIKSRSYTEHYDGDGTDTLLVEQWPIISVTSLHDDIDRKFESDSLIAAADYVIYGDNLGDYKIRLLGQGSFRFGYGPVFTDAVQNIKIVYTAGYATIPADIETASIIHVSHMFNKSAAEGHLSMSLGGLAKTYDPKAIPEEVKFMLEPYRKRAV